MEVQAELHPSADGLLSRMERVVTADAIILDKCGSRARQKGGISSREQYTLERFEVVRHT